MSVGAVTSLAMECSTITVAIAPVPDWTWLSLTLSGITDLSGNPLVGQNQLSVIALAGDVNNDSVTSTTDVAQIRVAVGQPASTQYTREDLNCDGMITTTDLASARTLVH